MEKKQKAKDKILIIKTKDQLTTYFDMIIALRQRGEESGQREEQVLQAGRCC